MTPDFNPMRCSVPAAPDRWLQKIQERMKFKIEAERRKTDLALWLSELEAE